VNKERTNILIMGTLATGSSALVDMLTEYDNINVLPYEFNDFRKPGFVSDQLSYESSLSYPNVIDKEIRFVNFRWKLIYKSSVWKLLSAGMLDKIWEKEFQNKKLKAYKNSLVELFHIVFLKELNNSLKSDIPYSKKIELSNKWIQQIGSIFPSHYDFTLFNQALHPWSDVSIWPKVFSPCKLIIVYREPKDQLAEMVRREIIFSPFRSSQLNYGQFNIISIYGNDRKGRMKFLTDALKKRVEKIDQWMNVLKPDQVLFIDFEGLINHYEVYKTKIEQFLGVSSDRHKFKMKYFNPDKAKQRCIGIYKNYLSEEEIEDLASLEVWYNSKVKHVNFEQVGNSQIVNPGFSL
jgi:hypothetical protein